MTINSWNSQDPVQVAKGGTGAATLTGVLTGNGTSAVTANAVTEHGVLIGGSSNAVGSTAVGTAGQVLTSNGAGSDPTFQAAGGGGSGSVVQEVVSTVVGVTSTTSTYALDDSIPQNTEGAALMSVAITPTSATNVIEIFSCGGWFYTGVSMAVCLYQDSGADAVQVSAHSTTNVPIPIYFRVVAGGTSAITFYLRWGGSSGTTYLNSRGTWNLGGISTLYLRARELTV